MTIRPTALDDPERRARLRGGIILTRNPFEPSVMARGVGIGLLLALLVAAVGWPLTSATPIGAERAILGGLELGDAGELRSVALVLSHVGHLVPVALLAAVVSLVARWRWGGWDLGLLLLTVLGGASVVTGMVKLLTARARPDEAVVQTLSSAFPSGHAVRAAAVYGLIAWLVLLVASSRAVQVLVVLAAGGAVALNALARIALLAHWPSDVLVGVVLGAVWLTVSARLLRPRSLAEARRAANGAAPGGAGG